MITVSLERRDKIIICIDCGKGAELCANTLCRSCYNRQWYLEHREERREQIREWEKKNRKKRLKQKREYYRKNREYFRAYYKEYWKKYPSYDSAHYQENREEILSRHRRWAKDNPEKIRAYSARRYAKKRKLPNTLTVEQIELLLAIGRTIYPSEQLDLDHIVPMSKGGGTTLANMHAIPRSLNIWKKDKLPEEVYKQLGLWEKK